MISGDSTDLSYNEVLGQVNYISRCYVMTDLIGSELQFNKYMLHVYAAAY